MKKALLAAAVIGAAAVIAKRRVSGCGVDFERLIEGMPDGAPPKWMFHNIRAIRENTDRILGLLEEAGAEATTGSRP